MAARRKTAVVTGASRGIGLEIVRRLVQDGFNVAMVARTAHDLAASANCFPREWVTTIASDLLDLDTPRAISSGIPAGWEPASVLVNNGALGSAMRDGRSARYMELTLDEWDSALGTNLTAAFRLCQHFLPGMVSQGWGRIINVSSAAGRGKTVSSGAGYCVSKAGLIALTRALASEFGPSGVTANTIAPGMVETDMLAARPKELNAPYLANIPVGRIGMPGEIASAITFLVGPESGFLNGAIIDINGGSWMP